MSELALQLIRQAKAEGWTTLDLGRTGLRELPEELFELEQLETLIISNVYYFYKESRWIESKNSGDKNFLKGSLPSGLMQLQQLKHLWIGGDFFIKWEIKEIAALEGLTGLSTLDLSDNQITDIRLLENLTSLTTLDLSGNQINDIRPLKNLTSLSLLYLSDNQIKDISPLHPLIKGGTSLNWEYDGRDDGIYLENNPLGIPPVEVVKEGNAAILRYFEELKKSKNAQIKPYINNEIKLIIVGNSTVGKTTLATYLKDRKVARNLPSTHWMQVIDWDPSFILEKLKSEENETGKCKVRIFDFGGQEYYHDTHHIFFSNNTAYLLLWDSESNTMQVKNTNILMDSGEKKASSEVQLQYFPIEYWLEAIEYYCKYDNISTTSSKSNYEENDEFLSRLEKDLKLSQAIKKGTKLLSKESKRVREQSLGSNKTAPILIIQNKIDNEKGIVPLDQKYYSEQHTQVYNFLAISLHKKKYLKSLLESIQEMFEQMQIVGSKLPAHWGVIKESLPMYKGEPVISLNEFTTYCNNIIKKNKISIRFTRDTAYDLCKYLFNIGYLLFYDKSDLQELHNAVFIDQKWIIEHIYKVLKNLEKRNAQFDKKYVHDIFKNNEQERYVNLVITLMLHFKIIIEHPHKEDTFIAPLYLPPHPLKAVELFLDNFQIPITRLEYKGFILKSIILDFFKEYGKNTFYESQIDDERTYYFWRYGIVISDRKDNNTKPEDIVLVRFFMGNELENSPAHIDIFSLQQKKESPLVKNVIKAFETINQAMSVEQMVSANGIDFVPLSMIKQMEEKQYFVFSYNGKRYELSDFAEHLTKNYPMKKVFISYSQKDIEYLKQLETHLIMLKRNRFIATWTDRQLIPGEAWDGKIKQELSNANIIIFLISADFLATDYIWDVEMRLAIEKHESGKAKVVPIIVRACDWEESPLGKFNSPEKGLVISSVPDRDEAWKNVITNLKKIIEAS